jgi:hypothetical protein
MAEEECRGSGLALRQEELQNLRKMVEVSVPETKFGEESRQVGLIFPSSPMVGRRWHFAS